MIQKLNRIRAALALRIQAKKREYVTCYNPSKMIVFDIETTGLDAEKDDVLQISIIDGNGKTLINEYVHR